MCSAHCTTRRSWPRPGRPPSVRFSPLRRPPPSPSFTAWTGRVTKSVSGVSNVARRSDSSSAACHSARSSADSRGRLSRVAIMPVRRTASIKAGRYRPAPSPSRTPPSPGPLLVREAPRRLARRRLDRLGRGPDRTSGGSVRAAVGGSLGLPVPVGSRAAQNPVCAASPRARPKRGQSTKGLAADDR